MRGLYLAALFIAANASAQSFTDTRSISVSPTPVVVTPTATSAETATLGELIARLDALQREVQQLRGELERQTYQMRQLKQQQQQLYTDLDQRLRLLLTPQSTTPALAQVEPQTTTIPPVVATPPVQAVRADPALYDQALEQLKQGDYPKAAAGFQQFISQNPQGELAENAYYWLAETLYVNRQLPEAQAAFERMLSAYPSSAKAADALYKIGRIQLDTGNLDKAKQTLADVQTRHPNTTAARLAEQQLRRLKPGGS